MQWGRAVVKDKMNCCAVGTLVAVVAVNAGKVILLDGRLHRKVRDADTLQRWIIILYTHTYTQIHMEIPVLLRTSGSHQ